MSSVITDCRFVTGAQGRLFEVSYTPAASTAHRGSVVVIPPFAEELNKTRATLSTLCRALAQLGFACRILDLYGCGDSEGEFCDASWAGWQHDIVTYLGSELPPGPVTLFGLRLSALLICSLPGPVSYQQLILCQPALNGEMYLREFFRLRLAGNLLSERTETLAQLQQQLDQQGHIEILGYELTRTLYDQIRLSTMPNQLDPSLAVDWITLTRQLALSLPAQQQIERWQQTGTVVSYHPVDASPFWATDEIIRDHQLIDLITQLVDSKC